MAMQRAMLDQQALSNFREFLEIYNKTTERCFNHCVIDLHSRKVNSEEEKCLNDCTTKTSKLQHRLVNAFMVEQPRITQQKIEKAQKEAEAMMKQLEAQGISAENMSPEEMAQKMMENMPTTATNKTT